MLLYLSEHCLGRNLSHQHRLARLNRVCTTYFIFMSTITLLVALSCDEFLASTCETGDDSERCINRFRIFGVFLYVQVAINLVALNYAQRKDDLKTKKCYSGLPIHQNNSWRHCEDCDIDVPPRAFHCPLCDVCILKRDHHCFFTGACIGFHNQRYFIVLLFYTTLSCALAWKVSVNYFRSHGFEVIGLEFYRVIFPLTGIQYLLGHVSQTLFLLSVFFFSTTCNVILAGLTLKQQLIYALLGCTYHEMKARDYEYNEGPLKNMNTVFGKWGLLLFLAPFTFLPYAGNGRTWKNKFR